MSVKATWTETKPIMSYHEAEENAPQCPVSILAMRAERLQRHSIAEYLAAKIKMWYLYALLFLLKIILFNQYIRIENLKPFEILLKEKRSCPLDSFSQKKKELLL